MNITNLAESQIPEYVIKHVVNYLIELNDDKDTITFLQNWRTIQIHSFVNLFTTQDWEFDSFSGMLTILHRDNQIDGDMLILILGYAVIKVDDFQDSLD